MNIHNSRVIININKDLRNRIQTGVIFASVTFLALYLGGLSFVIYLLFLFSIASYEWAFLAKAEHHWLLIVIQSASPLLSIVLCYTAGAIYILPVLSASLLATVVVYTLSKRENTSVMLIGEIYLTIAAASLYILRSEVGLHEVAWLWLTVMTFDSCAYFVGKYFGRHKLAPKISKNKTWEGFIGGVILSSSLGVLWGHFLLQWGTLLSLLLGLLICLCAQGGDLFVSYFKRKRNTKDTGSILPGHGGILDRIDSILLSLPFFFFYLIVINYY